MKFLISFILLSISYWTSSAKDIPKEFQDIGDRISDKLRADAKDNKLKDVLPIRLHRNITMLFSGKKYDWIKLQTQQLTGLDNVELKVEDFARARSIHGPDWIEGKLSGGPVTIAGKVEFKEQDEINTHSFELNIVSAFERPVRFRFSILADNHGHGKVKVEDLEPDFAPYIWEHKMTSCNQNSDPVCKDMVSLVRKWDAKTLEDRLAVKLIEVINGYILE